MPRFGFFTRRSVQAQVALLLLTCVVLMLLLGMLGMRVAIQHYHEDVARRSLEEADTLVKDRLGKLGSRLERMSQQLATDNGNINALNMISVYADPAHYDALIFDTEKQKLAHKLGTITNTILHGSAVFHDAAGRIAALARDSEEESIEAFSTWQEGAERVLYRTVGSGAGWSPMTGETAYLAEGFEFHDDQPGVHFHVKQGHLSMAAMQPVFRRLVDGGRRRVGSVTVAEYLDVRFLADLNRVANASIGMVLSKELALGRPPAMANEAVLAAASQGESPHAFEHSGEFMLVRGLQVYGGQRVALIYTYSKDEMDRMILSRTGGFLIILSIAGLLVVPFGIYLARRTLSEPVARLMQDVAAIKLGDYATLTPRQNAPLELDALSQSFRDMADALRRREDELRLWSKVMVESREGMMITDADHRIVRVNRAFTDITGFCADEAIGRTPEFMDADAMAADSATARQQILEQSGHWQGEVRDRRKDGSIYSKWLAISAVAGSSGATEHYVAIFSDMSEHKEREERIHYLAHHDILTGLPNRLLLHDRVNMAILDARRLDEKIALLFIDLDRFKNINDSLGHSVGDRLLQEVATRLGQSLRAADTVCRLGGDEFVISLVHLRDAQDAASVAEKVKQAISAPFELDDRQLSITPSIGIAVFPDNAEDVEGLIRCADTAMYHAKDLGRNNYQYFTPAMNAAVEERMALEHQLRQALELGQFQLYYQPQINIVDDRLVGVEALIRWRLASGEQVSPARFIPVAEETGLILPIGDWVLAEACRQRRLWTDNGVRHFPVAINCSALQFRQAGFGDKIIEAIKAAGLAPGDLELELTESVVMSDPEEVRVLMASLQEAGVALAIDDFGTGYSSLSYLKRLPLSKLKIDASFVQGITTDAADLAIVRAIISLGHSLNLRLVAEGVEDADMLNILREHGCQIAQGYYHARPMPAAELEAWLGSRPI